MLLIWSGAVQAAVVFHEDFEKQQTLKGHAILRVNENPHHGNFHALFSNPSGESAQYSSGSAIALHTGTQYCLSFFAAFGTKGMQAKFNLWVGDQRVAQLSSADFLMRAGVYTNLIAPIFVQSGVSGELKLEVVAENGLFNEALVLVDDIILREVNTAWVQRPLATTPASNLNGLRLDALTSLRVNNQLIFEDKTYTADGYRWLTTPVVIATQQVDIEMAFGDAKGAHHMVAWVDWNGDGVFQDDERVAQEVIEQTGATRSFTVVFPENQPDGDYVVRIRYLPGSTNPDAVTGKCWGDTKDFIVSKQAAKGAVDAYNLGTDDCRFFDLSGKEIPHLANVPVGVYVERCGDCVRKLFAGVK
jgi:hypothetical protein